MDVVDRKEPVITSDGRIFQWTESEWIQLSLKRKKKMLPLVIQGDALKSLSNLGAGIIQTCITSPPYYGLRDYQTEGQIGLEETPEEYVEKLVQVFREVRRVLRDDGTLWLNLGDTYSQTRWSAGEGQPMNNNRDIHRSLNVERNTNLPPKNLIGIPWKVAFALQADGWILRQDIIWAKKSCMPEPVTDRCTKSHEYIFLFAKQQKYYYDHEAIMTPAKQDWGTRDRTNGKYHNEGTGLTPHTGLTGIPKITPGGHKDTPENNAAHGMNQRPESTSNGMANKRSVWTMPTAAYKEAHFATFPEELVETCIKAGSKVGDLILDPFSGAGTTGVVAVKLLRQYLGIDLNLEYCKMSEERIAEASAQNRIFV